jgi:nitrate/TMAO reductase-like tetraheme cytochrome c subunit
MRAHLQYFVAIVGKVYFFKQFNVELYSQATIPFELLASENSYITQIEEYFYDYQKLINGNKVPSKQIAELVE